jgi:serine/threonine protein kinase
MNLSDLPIIGKGESGYIHCVDQILMDMSDEITIIPHNEDDVEINTLDFFTHLRENGICMKIFFPPEMMRGKTLEDSGFNREYQKVVILAGLKNFISEYTPYASYEGNYGFKMRFKHGIKMADAVTVNSVYIILIKLCINNHNPLFGSSFNSKVFKRHMRSALKLLHSNGYCHNDLHIGNVVLCLGETPQYKLIDFEHMATCNDEDQKDEFKSVEDMGDKQKRDDASSSFRRSKLGGTRKKATRKMVRNPKSKSKSKFKSQRRW